MAMSVGYIGLGKLGELIAGRILGAGFRLAVWNRSPDKMQSVVARGAIAAASPAEVAGQCDVVCTCVTDNHALEEVLFGDDGVCSAQHRPKILVDNSTIHPLRARELANRLIDDAGIRWIDAPVSGGIPGARAGTLAAMAGGAAEDIEIVRPLVLAFYQGAADPAWHGVFRPILLKDMGIVLDLARNAGRVAPIFGLVESFYRMMDGPRE